MAEASSVDLVQQLLDAAANPTPGPWYSIVNDLIGGWAIAGYSCPVSEKQKGQYEIADMLGREEDSAFIAAARNSIRALAEEWLRYGQHESDCDKVSWPARCKDGCQCTCGWSARRASIEAYLKATKP